jgi:hypothetical protein
MATHTTITATRFGSAISKARAAVAGALAPELAPNGPAEELVRRAGRGAEVDAVRAATERFLERTKRELFGPEPAPAAKPPQEPQGTPRPRDAADPRVQTGPGGRPRPEGPPMLAETSVATLRGMADSQDPEERARLRIAVSRMPSLLEVLSVDQRPRLAEEVRR